MIHVLIERGCSNRSITRPMRIDEKAVRDRRTSSSWGRDNVGQGPLQARASLGRGTPRVSA